jgi:hypothetical protein
MADLLKPDYLGPFSLAVHDALTERLFALIDLVSLDAYWQKQLVLALKLAELEKPVPGVRANQRQIEEALKGRIRAHAFAGALAYQLSDGDPLRATHDSLRAHIVVGELLNDLLHEDERMRERHRHRNDAALVAVRLIIRPKERRQLSLLNGHTGSFEAISTVVEGNKGRSHPGEAARLLEPISVLVRTFLQRARAPDKSSRTPEPLTYHTFLTPVQATLGDADEMEDEGANAYGLAIEQSFAGPGTEKHFAEIEYAPSALLIHVRDRGAQFARTSSDHRWQARALSHHYYSLRAGLPSAFDSLTDHEIAKIRQTAEAALIPANEGQSARSTMRGHHWCILASLYLGRTLTDILDLVHAKPGAHHYLGYKDGVLALLIPGIPNRKKSEWPGDVFEGPVAGHHRIALPAILATNFSAVSRKNAITVSDIRATLRGIGLGRERRANEGSLARALREALIRADADRAVVDLLCGVSPMQATGLHYLYIAQSELQAVYAHGVQLLGCEPGIPNAPDSDLYVGGAGSSTTPRISVVQQFYSEAARVLKRFDKSSRANLIAYHNRYCALVVANLMILTGHRPVIAPFDKPRTLDFETGLLYISDKQIRSVNAGRIVPLPQLALRQFALWHSHLIRLAEILALSAAAAGSGSNARYRIEGLPPTGDDIHFFTLAELGNGTIAKEPFRPRLAKEWLKDIWPLSERSGRHLLRRELHRARVSSDLIDALMAHDEPGREPFAEHSGLALADLEGLRQALDDYCTRIRARAFVGLGV